MAEANFFPVHHYPAYLVGLDQVQTQGIEFFLSLECDLVFTFDALTFREYFQFELVVQNLKAGLQGIHGASPGPVFLYLCLCEKVEAKQK